MIRQLWGPFVNLVGDGGFKALTIGDWFLMKYANIVMYAIVAAVFIVAMIVNVPERRRELTKDSGNGSHNE